MRRWLRLAAISWLAVALLAGQRFVALWQTARSMPGGDELLGEMLARGWWMPTIAWLALAPVAAGVGMVLPFGGLPWPRLLACHAAIAAVVGAAVVLATPAPEPIVFVGSAPPLAPATAMGLDDSAPPSADMPEWLAAALQRALSGEGPMQMFEPGSEAEMPPGFEMGPRVGASELWLDGSGHATTWLLLVAIAAGLTFRREVRARERRAVQLESEMARIELSALRAQMQPHFLFNALNSLQALIATEPRRALEVLRELAGLLRGSQRELSKELVPLSRELEMLRHYVHIERLRFGDRVAIEIAVADALGDFEVPPFCLQPLVENALRHGPGRAVSGGTIRVAGRLDDGTLSLTVSDRFTRIDEQGESPGAAAAGDSGFGTDYVRQRLRRAFGDAARLVSRDEPNGHRATIEIDAAVEASS